MAMIGDRRQLLRLASGLALAAFLRPASAAAGPAERRPVFLDDPFKLGVASGDPVADGVVLWTRLAPDPLEPRATADGPVVVGWTVAEDEALRKPVRSGSRIAWPENAHAVHVDVGGLEPGREYFYRFTAGDAASPVGRTMTAPLPGAALDRFRFAFASCQHYETGFFNAWRDVANERPDLVVHLGDYIYEYAATGIVRRHPWRKAETLDDFRAFHAVYKGDPDLQAAHAAAPWLMIPDDHEVENDYAADRSAYSDDPRAFLAMRAAAYKAWYEHMPARRLAGPRDGAMHFHHQARFGDLVAFNLLDGRQYRSPHICPGPENRAGRLVAESTCPELFDETRTMLGADQERWLKRNLARAETRWNIIAQPLMFAPLDQGDGVETMRYTDSWGGFQAARRRLLADLAETAPANPVFIGGDIHSFWVNDIHGVPGDPGSPLLATEFVSSSISSTGVDFDTFSGFLPRNPHVRYFESRRRGHAMATLTRERMEVELRAVVDVRDPSSPVELLGRHVVDSGRPGARPA